MVQTDKVREEFAQRLALASKEAGLDDHGKGIAIARALKISSKGVSKWFNGESIPRQATMQELAKFLKVDPVWLQLGINPNGGGNVSYVGKKKTTNEFPLISWVSAGCWLEAVEPYRKDEIDVWPETTVDASDSSFWLRVKGDSMTSPSGFTVPEGMIILVDPEKEAVSGKLVVAKLENENEATFKQYMTDAGRKFLKALNPHHPPTIINGNCKIIGVVVDIKWEHIP
ncbi:TPA: LexA family protein [Yersinia enterocolitica]|nr:helix-turn-helix domain-containing protein [Yersinia enterocolitica]EKN6107308.1 helix-turn-helix domain-containing protein [Yersinia enterocolitica]EKN6145191.1 helix-turn-helix domain-containing protein [Yersinia enterocolitica]ELZ0587363.1 helix-turn-helix domain-containing protein [Yersinia enterocolitica]HDW8040604.1 helix-turn-helix domain-containing protein [Yersinia enterocolitica]